MQENKNPSHEFQANTDQDPGAPASLSVRTSSPVRTLQVHPRNPDWLPVAYNDLMDGLAMGSRPSLKEWAARLFDEEIDQIVKQVLRDFKADEIWVEL